MYDFMLLQTVSVIRLEELGRLDRRTVSLSWKYHSQPIVVPIVVLSLIHSTLTTERVCDLVV